jgi:hypothetical protein
LRLRLLERAFDRAGKIFRLGGGFLQVLDDPPDKLGKHFGGNRIDLRIAGAQQIANFGNGLHRGRAAASRIDDQPLEPFLPPFCFFLPRLRRALAGFEPFLDIFVHS